MLLLLLAFVGGCQAITVTPGAYLVMNGTFQDSFSPFDNGYATYGAYDDQTNILYVIGTRGDVLHVISMANPEQPVEIETQLFNQNAEGLPDSISLCRSGDRQYLAIGFERLGTSTRSSLRVYRPLDAASSAGSWFGEDEGNVLYNDVPLSGYDPTSMAWGPNCGVLLVVHQGRTHQINNFFDDPRFYVDILTFQGPTPTRKTVEGFNDTTLTQAGVRYVLDGCTTGGEGSSFSLSQDAEPSRVVIDSGNVAYITFTKNNALARIDLNSINPVLEFSSVGTKDWSQVGLDSATDDNAAFQTFNGLHSFYQPFGIIVLETASETFIATADQGEIIELSNGANKCEFSEALPGSTWIQSNDFGYGVTGSNLTAMRTALANNAQLGQFYATNLKRPQEYFDSSIQGYDQVTGYGGRGWSILRPSTLERVYDSGNDFEAAIINSQNSAYEAVFNADIGQSFNEVPSSRRDATSVTTGPTPKAIATGMVGNQNVVVISNGNVGGLYFYTVDMSGDVPAPAFSSYTRRGNPALSWIDLYNAKDGSVGEPGVRDIVWMNLADGRAVIAVISDIAGAVSFYTIS